jgi:hypothetical protein
MGCDSTVSCNYMIINCCCKRLLLVIIRLCLSFRFKIFNSILREAGECLGKKSEA